MRSKHGQPPYKLLRLWSMVFKECIQIKRDFPTYIILILVPLLQVILFGYIINADAKKLPTAIVSYDSSAFTRGLIKAFQNTGYFTIKKIITNNIQAENLLKRGEVKFIINIPPDFSHDLIKKNYPQLLVEGDGSDPVTILNAFHAAATVVQLGMGADFKGALGYLATPRPNFSVVTHANYNPGLKAQYHTLPGLLVTMLTLVPVMLTAISITAEYELGTMELLLVTPLRPLEVIFGKLIPHIILGYILFFMSLAASYYIFNVPFLGSLLLCVMVTFPFLIAHLGIGFAVSTISKTQFQAGNIANLYFLPAIILSGFMFPFYAMPGWAQWLGTLFPPVHYLRVVSGIMLKGATFIDVWPDIWPILVFMVFIIFVSFKFYRRTLDE